MWTFASVLFGLINRKGWVPEELSQPLFAHVHCAQGSLQPSQLSLTAPLLFPSSSSRPGSTGKKEIAQARGLPTWPGETLAAGPRGAADSRASPRAFRPRRPFSARRGFSGASGAAVAPRPIYKVRVGRSEAGAAATSPRRRAGARHVSADPRRRRRDVRARGRAVWNAL